MRRDPDYPAAPLIASVMLPLAPNLVDLAQRRFHWGVANLASWMEVVVAIGLAAMVTTTLCGLFKLRTNQVSGWVRSTFILMPLIAAWFLLPTVRVSVGRLAKWLSDLAGESGYDPRLCAVVFVVPYACVAALCVVLCIGGSGISPRGRSWRWAARGVLLLVAAYMCSWAAAGYYGAYVVAGLRAGTLAPTQARIDQLIQTGIAGENASLVLWAGACLVLCAWALWHCRLARGEVRACESCGYSMDGLPVGVRCPECGKDCHR